MNTLQRWRTAGVQMRSELERRTRALETKAGMGGEQIEVIIRTFVSPEPNGPVRSEPKAVISLPHGWRITRDLGESADAFVTRAAGAAPRVSAAVTRLVAELGAVNAYA
jgi:hypothetical protein